MSQNKWMGYSLLLGLLLLGSQALNGQVLPVGGTVTSASKGKPIKGVEVAVKDTKKKVETDKEGRYELQVERDFYSPGAATVLVFTHKDYKLYEIEIVDEQELDVSLLPIGAVPVNTFRTGTAAGISQEQLPFAATAITEPLLLNEVPAANISGGWQGKAPGLTVHQSGYEPGQNAYLQLRAASVLANGQSPLLMIDGIYLQSNDLADFNADDLERVEILQGAAASAPYGSQGGNGVIQLFTRTGQQLGVGETRITYRGEYGYSEPTNRYALSERTNREIVEADGPQPVLGAVVDSLRYNNPLPNLQDYQSDLLFENGAYSSHYLSMEGKTSSTSFMVSGQRLRDQGIIRGEDGQARNILRANLDHQAGKRLHLSFRSQYTQQTQGALPLMATNPSDYLAGALYLTPIFGLDAPNEEDGTPFDWDIDNTGGAITNPLYLRENLRQSATRSRLVGSFDANLQVTRWLRLDYCATLDRLTNQYQQFLEKGFLSRQLPSGFTDLASAGTVGSNGGGIRQNTTLQNYFTSSAGFRVQRSFLGLSSRIRGGFLYENSTYNFNGAAGEDLAVEGVASLDNPQSQLSITSTEEEMVGYNLFLLADADYRDKFIFSAAIRQERSSLFGENAQWPGFQRAAIAYRLSEDIKLRFFQELKLRAAIGSAGIRPQYGQRFETFALVNGTLTKQNLGNDQLRPSTVSELEVGADMTFLRAFSIGATYAQTVTSDQIVFTPLSGGAGFQGQWRNAGTVEAEVYEASLNIDLAELTKIKHTGLRWDITAVGQRIVPTVTELGVPQYATGPGLANTDFFTVQEGLAPGTMLGEVFARGIDDLANQPDLPLNEYTLNDLGYIVRQDQIGTPNERPVKVLDDAGNPLLRPIGDPNPDARIGIANQFTFRGIQLYALLDWKIGGDLYNYTRQQLYANGRHADLDEDTGVATSFYTEGLYNDGAPTAYFVEDGSFLLLREAALSYVFDKTALLFLGGHVERIKLSLIGRNLFTSTDYSGFHPDITSAAQSPNLLSNRQVGGLGSNVFTPGGDPGLFALDGFGYPARRTFTFSVQITL